MERHGIESAAAVAEKRMTTRFIDQYEVILLDQGKTFMFENDRFGPGEGCYDTYRELGGINLTRGRLDEVMEGLVRHLLEIGRDPLRYESFPSVSEALRGIAAGGIAPEDYSILEELVARHELGVISPRHATAIRSLATSHRLGIVSNIWGRKNAFENNLLEAGILNCFEHCVWSSDVGCIKPSLKLFHHAFALFNIPASKVLFVGDHPFRDIAAAGQCGCSTAWIQNGNENFPHDCSPPDLIIRHLAELPDVPLWMPDVTAPS